MELIALYLSHYRPDTKLLPIPSMPHPKPMSKRLVEWLGCTCTMQLWIRLRCITNTRETFMKKSVLPKFSPRADGGGTRYAEAYRRFLRRQAKMGGQLFGPVPANRRREFFCLDQHTWVWHEEWTDDAGAAHAMTTRYTVGPQGVLKSQDSGSYQRVQGEELRNFWRAAHLYRDNVRRQAIAIQQ